MRGTARIFGTLVALAAIPCAAALAGCYSSAQAARESQTLGSEGWACYGEPIVSCPNRPDGVCTGWDNRWIATCPDDGSRWACRFANAGATIGDARLNDDRVFCARMAEGATVAASAETQ